MRIQQATVGDVAAAANTLALAFATDPVWGRTLARPDGSTEHLRPFWSIWLRGALSYGGLWIAPDAAAIATWIPPEGVELPGDLEAEMFALTEAALPSSSFVALQELWSRFDANHPHDESHAYLSLLATNPAQAGHGLGQQLLAATLREWDERGIPTYLESTNVANNHRYERAGFRAIGGFEAPLGGARVTTMWRDAAPAA